MKSSWLLSRARRRWLRCGGTVSPRTSSVIAIANTPSLNATMRLNSTSASSLCRACPPATGSNLGALLSATLGGTFAGSGALPPVDLARSDRYTPLGYILAASHGHLSQRLEGRSLDGLPGLVGAGARLRHLRDRPGLDPPPSDRGGALGHRPGAGRQGHRPRGPVPFLPLRRDPDRAVPVSCPSPRIAIARSLFEKGASAVTSLAFQFASTNLVWELGLVLWVLIGWQFTLAEYVGGIILIVLMAVSLRLFVSPRLEEVARRHAQEAAAGHHHG